MPFHIFCCATYKAPQTRGEPEAVKFKLEGLSGAKKLQLFMMQRLALFRCVVTLCYSKKFQVTILARQPCVCGGGGCLLCVVFCFVLFFLPPPKRPPCQNSRCVDEKKSHWKDWWDWIFVFLFCTALKEIYKEQSATKHKKSIYLGNGVAKWVTQMVWELESSQAGFSREKLRVARAGCDLTVPSSFSFPPQVYSSVYFCGHLFFLVAYLIMPYLRKALVPKNEGREKKQE